MRRWGRGGAAAIVALSAACARAPVVGEPGPSAPPIAVSVEQAPAPEASASAPEPAAPPSPTGLVFEVEPASAQVIVNGAPRGTVAGLRAGEGLLRLAPDLYRIELVHPGFRTWRGEVAVGASPEAIRVTLSRP